jgi:hypothetical protein
MAGEASAIQHALHADLGIVAESVERFFRDITTERLRRGVFTSVPELVAAINKYVASQQRTQAVHLDQERSRHLAKGHSRQ